MSIWTFIFPPPAAISPVSTVWLMGSGNFFMFSCFISERCRNTCSRLYREYRTLDVLLFNSWYGVVSLCCYSEHSLLSDPSLICTHSKAGLIVMEGSIECLDNGIDFRTAYRIAHLPCVGPLAPKLRVCVSAVLDWSSSLKSFPL